MFELTIFSTKSPVSFNVSVNIGILFSLQPLKATFLKRTLTPSFGNRALKRHVYRANVFRQCSNKTLFHLWLKKGQDFAEHRHSGENQLIVGTFFREQRMKRTVLKIIFLVACKIIAKWTSFTDHSKNLSVVTMQFFIMIVLETIAQPKKCLKTLILLKCNLFFEVASLIIASRVRQLFLRHLD